MTRADRPRQAPGEPWRPVDERWSAGGAGTRYAGERWRNPRARERDPRLVERLLRSVELPRDARVLDVPCGAGRLTAGLSRHGRTHGVDVSTEMLAAARAQSGGSDPLPVMLGDKIPNLDRQTITLGQLQPVGNMTNDYSCACIWIKGIVRINTFLILSKEGRLIHLANIRVVRK